MKFKKDIKISVKKLSLDGKTPDEFARMVCEMTFLGNSKISLNTLYKSEHSPARSQIFWVTFSNIPLFISTHFIRHHVGSIPFQLTCRDDRYGGNVGLKEKLLVFSDVPSDRVEEYANILFNSIDRYTPVNLGLLINAQSLIDMFKMRLCLQSHKETVWVTNKLKEEIEKVDKDLVKYLVPKCVYRCGLCNEPKPCGFNQTNKFNQDLIEYLKNFNEKQIPKNLK